MYFIIYTSFGITYPSDEYLKTKVAILGSNLPRAEALGGLVVRLAERRAVGHGPAPRSAFSKTGFGLGGPRALPRWRRARASCTSFNSSLRQNTSFSDSELAQQRPLGARRRLSRRLSRRRLFIPKKKKEKKILLI